MINKDFFKVWSSEMAYVLGFLYADGCINIRLHPNGKEYYSFQFKSKDLDVIEYCKRVMNAHQKISCSNERYQLYCGSREMCEDLISLEIKPGIFKSTTESNIEVPDDYKSDFWHGFFDGDGGLTIRKRGNKSYIESYFCFTSETMRDLCRDWLTKENIKHTYYLKSRQKGKTIDVWYVLISNREGNERLYNLLYKDYSVMKRKKDRFEEVVNVWA